MIGDGEKDGALAGLDLSEDLLGLGFIEPFAVAVAAEGVNAGAVVGQGLNHHNLVG